ncbi:hypothetical protein [Clostridium sp. JNZ J1-5]
MASKNNIEIIKEKYQIARTSRKPIDTIVGFLTPAMTLRYIGITKDVINDVYDGLNL